MTPALTIEMFLMDGPMAGFVALELVDPPPSKPHGEDHQTQSLRSAEPGDRDACLLVNGTRSRPRSSESFQHPLERSTHATHSIDLVLGVLGDAGR